MPSILDAYTSKKGAKEFEKLPNESKAQVIQAAIIEKTSHVMAQEIAKGIIKGTEFEQEHIYNEFVSKIDAYKIESQEWHDAVDKLLSYIRVKHVNYLSKKENEKKNGADDIESKV